MINSYKQTLWNYIQAVETENLDVFILTMTRETIFISTIIIYKIYYLHTTCIEK